MDVCVVLRLFVSFFLDYDAARPRPSTVISATPCTCVSCSQSRDAVNFLVPGREGTKCSVTQTAARLSISLGQEMTVGVTTLSHTGTHTHTRDVKAKSSLLTHS